jgi:hypothetical protein
MLSVHIVVCSGTHSMLTFVSVYVTYIASNDNIVTYTPTARQ